MVEANSGAGAPAKQSSGPDPLIGKLINDRFKIVSLIARGGMGKVYRAEQAPLGREIALKVLNPNYSGEHDPEFHKRFFLEASICSKLTHPNTVTIFDYGRSEDDVYYIAMELLEGKTLHRALRESAPMDAARVMHVGRQVCRSLREAHGLGVIHRDLKPANIFLVRHGDETDFVKVLDFGLVKNVGDTGEDLTQTGLFMGSPKYMSPEQIRGEPVDGRSDVYALGVIMYEMLTGKVPFDRPSSVNILMAHVHEAPPPMHEISGEARVPALLEQIVMKCIAKSPADRFASMDELLVALKQAAGDSGLAVSLSGEHSVTSGEFRLSPGETGSFPPPTVTASPLENVIASHSGTPSGGIAAPASVADGPETQRSSRGILLGLTLAAAAIAVGVVLAFTGDDPAEAPSDPEPVGELGAGPTPAEGPDDVEAAPIASVIVSLRSSPAGATVVVNDREYGPTPAEVEWTGDDAERGREVTLRFQKDGFRELTVTRTITSDRLEVDATLEAIEAIEEETPAATAMRRTPVRRPTAMMTEEPESPVGPIKGYKTDPY